ncbi:MAG TPA: cupredoxin domain-containing protein [Acidimicrobiales bacterium]|nr:cupredoxin domain-containing protein [Acidimicrobiales bacterium]
MRTPALHRTLAALAAGALVLGLAACGDDDDDAADTGDDTEEVTSTTAPADEGGGETEEGATIVAADNLFQDGTLTVAAGTEVALDNTGSNPHTVTSDDPDLFDTGTVSGGAQGEFVAPSEPGTYAFHCDIHPAAMTGTLTVT